MIILTSSFFSSFISNFSVIFKSFINSFFSTKFIFFSTFSSNSSTALSICSFGKNTAFIINQKIIHKNNTSKLQTQEIELKIENAKAKLRNHEIVFIMFFIF
ncbi:hypothetical protein DLH72_00155 [Candidatus Gracilibacteria bacterium]|nr:MAG: hypothetical protein DLH72_00155 [Candidatus Gracilibacteria bacterium]